MMRSSVLVTLAAYAAGSALFGVVGCGGGDFSLASGDGGTSSSSGAGGSSSGTSGSSSGAGSSSSSGTSSGTSSGASSGASSGSSSGAGSSGGSGGDSGGCPPGESWCPPCGNVAGYCAQVCPAIACGILDAGKMKDATSEGGPTDASVGDAACPPGEFLCQSCNGPPFCGQVCPGIVCLGDAATPLDASKGTCNPACGTGMTCCPGGAAGSYSCQTTRDGGCLPVP